MHGLIFLQLQKFAQMQGGPQVWESLIREAGLPAKTYSPARAYPDEEALALVGAASRLLNLPPSAVLESFGDFIAPALLRLYARLIRPEWRTLDVVENTESLIHTAVRMGNPGAEPPVLDILRSSQDEVQIIYSSERKMCALARGILVGVARHYGESIEVTEEACMCNGDPFCALHVRLHQAVPDTSEASIHETIAFRPVTHSQVGDSRFPFLAPPVKEGDVGRLADYRILGMMGQGGMGIVFQAVDRRLDRQVALKVLQPRVATDGAMRQRFVREAKTLASIRSDHVVGVFEVGTAGDIPFMAMEFLEGETLEAHQKRLGKIPPARAARIGLEIALGLAAVHDRGLIHRDIKPDNLWIEAGSGRVKILDFGLARGGSDAERVTQTGVMVGTPAFMAPEQANGQIGQKADLFSLGCVLYRLCTNELPFKGADIMSSLMALATHHPDPPRTISADVPHALSDLIMQLLKKDPAARPASSRAVAEVLGSLEREALLESAADG